MTRARVERCVCGGSILVKDGDPPGPAVLMHNRSPQHEAWRLGLTLEGIPTTLPCPDGLPPQRIGPGFSMAERLGHEPLR